ncbi:hypothetical protein HK104_009892 [Borealophlyctis nickersoniae]|nr:hypothetical protein HK104_009892 [Borealophlyctis nickersoniae]
MADLAAHTKAAEKSAAETRAVLARSRAATSESIDRLASTAVEGSISYLVRQNNREISRVETAINDAQAVLPTDKCDLINNSLDTLRHNYITIICADRKLVGELNEVKENLLNARDANQALRTENETLLQRVAVLEAKVAKKKSKEKAWVPFWRRTKKNGTGSEGADGGGSAGGTVLAV